MKKGDFIGKQSLLKELKQKSGWSFFGIEIEWPEFEKHYRNVG
ncbi:MAG: hypothetical protein Ct9H300mP18_08890 [Candidatus Neomarinimicrobiota bacterium]|nr:MAG: hypothetical protein Ct9H300mP18_08890 [Candidatus Neomarinimicrobiota bacterium]